MAAQHWTSAEYDAWDAALIQITCIALYQGCSLVGKAGLQL